MGSKYDPLSGHIVQTSGAAGNIAQDSVLTYALLPDPTTVSGQVYNVETNTGVIFINRRKRGLYKSDGVEWTYYTSFTATQIPYDNSTSLLTATNVKNAVDELENEIDTANTSISLKADQADLLQEVTDRTNADVILQTDIDGRATQASQDAQDLLIAANTAKLSATGNEIEPSDIDTLSELNAIITDATLIDTNDPRLSDARLPLGHLHTPSEVGLSNVDNTNDLDKPISTAVQNSQDAQDLLITANTAKVSFPEAPQDGTPYARQDGTWIETPTAKVEHLYTTSSSSTVTALPAVNSPVIIPSPLTTLNSPTGSITNNNDGTYTLTGGSTGATFKIECVIRGASYGAGTDFFGLRVKDLALNNYSNQSAVYSNGATNLFAAQPITKGLVVVPSNTTLTIGLFLDFLSGTASFSPDRSYILIERIS